MVHSSESHKVAITVDHYEIQANLVQASNCPQFPLDCVYLDILHSDNYRLMLSPIQLYQILFKIQ